uniref:Uncharacterized protein n=1 Tax=Anopheles atroparvus TaxID=41427 RepID=A0A182JI53_ANOAO
MATAVLHRGTMIVRLILHHRPLRYGTLDHGKPLRHRIVRWFPLAGNDGVLGPLVQLHRLATTVIAGGSGAQHRVRCGRMLRWRRWHVTLHRTLLVAVVVLLLFALVCIAHHHNVHTGEVVEGCGGWAHSRMFRPKAPAHDTHFKLFRDSAMPACHIFHYHQLRSHLWANDISSTSWRVMTRCGCVGLNFGRWYSRALIE